MNLDEFREAQVRLNNRMEEVISEREPLHQIRKHFVTHFTEERILKMDIQEYAAGYGKPREGYNF